MKKWLWFFAFLSIVLAFTRTVRSAENTVIARVGDISLNEEDLEKEVGMELYNAEVSVFQAKRNWINQKAKTIMFDAEAKTAKLSRKAWEEKEIDAKVTPPTQDEIQQILKRYPPQQSSSSETVKQVIQYLSTQKRLQREQQLMGELSAKYPITLFLKAPEMPKVDVSFRDDDPVKGPANAPVTILEFTDFQCPFCQRSQETLRQIETIYKDKVKLIARQYPLPFHNRARPSSLAALCAKEQGKFWEFRDKLFEKQQLENADFNRYAKELQLNLSKFDKCLKSQRYLKRIDEDIAEGQRFGVKGTPHFFINGRPLSGAQPLEVFKQAIDEELQKK